MIDLAALLEDPRRASELPLGALPSILIQFAAVHTALAARLATGHAATERDAAPASEGDKWLTVAEADGISNLGKVWLYRHWKQVGGAKKFSSKKLRFHEPAFRRWLQKRT